MEFSFLKAAIENTWALIRHIILFFFLYEQVRKWIDISAVTFQINLKNIKSL